MQPSIPVRRSSSSLFLSRLLRMEVNSIKNFSSSASVAFWNKCGTRVDKNKVAASEAMAEAEAHQMDGTREEEQEAQYVVNEIENASADIIMDIVNH